MTDHEDVRAGPETQPIRLPENDDENERLNQELLQAVRQAKHSVWVILSVLGLMVLLLTGAVAWLIVMNQESNVSLRVQQQAIHSSQLSACALGNRTRRDQISLWLGVIAAQKNPNPAEKNATDQFLTLLNSTFAPIDCAKLYPDR